MTLVKNTKRRAVVVCLFLIFMLSFVTARGSEPDSAIADTVTVKSPYVFGLSDTKPWSWKGAGGQLHGVLVGLTEAFMAGMPDPENVRIVVASTERLITELAHGNIDLVYMTDGERVQKSAVKLSGLGYVSIGVWSRKQRPVSPANPLRSQRVGIGFRAFRGHPLLQGSLVSEFSTPRAMIKMLLSDRLDSVIGFDVVMDYSAKELGLARHDFSYLPAGKGHVGLWLSQSSNKFSQLSALKATAQKTNDSVILEVLLRKYLQGNFVESLVTP